MPICGRMRATHSHSWTQGSDYSAWEWDVSKALLMSMLIMTILIPVRHSREPDGKRALKRAITEFAWFGLAYMVALRFIVWRFL